MTSLRRRPKMAYHTLIVKPCDGFNPRDWREKPESYSVLSYEGPEQLRGRADAWRFMFNQEQLNQGQPKQWAIVCSQLESLASNSIAQNNRMLSISN